MIKPKCWHVYIVNLEPKIGSKPGKQRPCVAIQPSQFAEHGINSTVILPITTQLIDDAFPLRIRVPFATAGLHPESDIMIDQILAWDNALFEQELGVLPDYYINQIKLALVNFLDF